MLQFRRTFETDKHQLQELNNRLGQYLSRTKVLEQENASLVAEINKLRQEKTVEWENVYKAEMRELRRTVGQLSFERSQAEMERERLWREFQMIQAMCCEETVVCKDIGGEIKGCEKQLQKVHHSNGALEERLIQLENEYKCMEDAHRHEIAHLRNQVHSRVLVTQKYHEPPAASMEEVQEYARCVSEGWIDTCEMYERRVEEMEESIRADQARLEDLKREKMLYVSEFEKLRAEAGNQSQIQMKLEGQLMHMQETFHADVNEYQMIIEELEQERKMLAGSMAERVREHQELLQVKMDLGLEVAAYRALLEGHRVDINETHMRGNHHQRERIIDIKMPSQPYRGSTSTRQDQRAHLDVRYMEPSSSVRRSPVPTHLRPTSPSRVIPISVSGRAAQQSPAARRDMVAFTKASQAAAAASSSRKPVARSADTSGRDVQRKVVEEKSVRTKEVAQEKNRFSPAVSPTADLRSVRVVSPPMMSLSTENNSWTRGREADAKKKDVNVTGMSKTNVKGSDGEGRWGARGSTTSEKKVLDSVSVEEIIEKVMKPAGLDAKTSSSGDSKVTYHVQKTEQEDGSTKTQIILESKLEREVDMSEDNALEELLSKGVKQVSLEDIKGTPTESIIQNLLSLGLQGGDLQNKSVNVEIIEEPVESESGGEEDDGVEGRSKPSAFQQPSSMFFQIEELEDVPRASKHHGREAEVKTTKEDGGRNGSVQVHEDSRDTDSPYFGHDQESQEYFVSTPDDNMSESEEGGGFASYGHYGVMDDLSDERYYQEGGLPDRKSFDDNDSDLYKFMTGDHSFVKEGLPECIIEEEVHVSPTVQESMLEFLKEDSLNPTEKLRGALEQLQGSVSGSLKDELALLTRADSNSPQSMYVRNVQQSSDNGTTTIVAELNVSQTLEESGLLGAQGEEASEEQIMAALRASHPGLLSGAEGGYSLRVSRDEDRTGGGGFSSSGESVTEVTEKHVRLGPSEKSFTFQIDASNGSRGAGGAGRGHFSPDAAEYGRMLQSQVMDPQLKVRHEKRIATVYLESSNDE